MPTAEEKRDAVQQRIPRQQRRSAADYFTTQSVTRAASEPFALLHVRIPEPLMVRLAGYGNAAHLNASESIRMLITEALDARDQQESP